MKPLLFLFCLLPSCVAYRSKTFTAVAFATDASKFVANEDGVNVTDLNQSNGVRAIGKTITGLAKIQGNTALMGATIKAGQAAAGKLAE